MDSTGPPYSQKRYEEIVKEVSTYIKKIEIMGRRVFRTYYKGHMDKSRGREEVGEGGGFGWGGVEGWGESADNYN